MVIYLIFTNVGFRSKRKNTYQDKMYQLGFYECGFRPRTQLSTKFSQNMKNLIVLAPILEADLILLIVIVLSPASLYILPLSIIFVIITLLITILIEDYILTEDQVK